MKRCFTLAAVSGLCTLWLPSIIRAGAIPVDLSGYDPACGVVVKTQDERLEMEWPAEGAAVARLVIDLRAGEPLFNRLSVGRLGTVLRDVDPAVFLVVGERKAPKGRPPQMSEFNVFFDSPANRPFQTYRSRLEMKRARVVSQGRRATVALGDLTAGPFSGEWQLTVFADSGLMRLEAVVATDEPHRAFLYDLGLMSDSPSVRRLTWIDTEGKPGQTGADLTRDDRALMVRHRTISAEGEAEGGSLACFPPPHQFFYPRDLTDNQSTVWYGRNHRGLDSRFGFGVRQTERGGGGFVPWFNAPPGTKQRLSLFLLPVAGTADGALKAALRYTHGDRFPRLEGLRTLTSHFHMAISMAALEEKARGGARSIPDFVNMFKEMGVDMVHLAEFHGDGHPRDPGPLRLPELSAMFDECRRLSDPDFLLIPGEEANAHLGLPAPGRHPGHWLYLFPKPVFWTMQRAPEQPFREADSTYGTVYHVGNRAEMLKLLEVENGLAWTAHPRIKASSWTPDVFRHEDFFLSDRWLGAAWKAMPADLSDDRLGRRALDLMDDMANWGVRKHVLGEIDVFKLNHTHELYGHMNVNYVALVRIPRYEEGWASLLDALRAGRFFTTTGEVLIPGFAIEIEPEKSSATVRAGLRWTFPLAFAELISGDGKNVFRQRIDLTRTGAFGDERLEFQADLDGRTWARLEVWDVARDGAFTQPVWLGQGTRRGHEK